MAAESEASSYGIGWRLSSVSGWGVYALNLTLRMIQMGRDPVLLLGPHRLDVRAGEEARLAPLFQRQVQLEAILRQGPRDVLEFDFPVLHALRNGIGPSLAAQAFKGEGNAGMIFFEDTDIGPSNLDNARDYDIIVTGSTWNADILGAAGVAGVVNVFQGIDEGLFHPAPKPGLYPGRFVVFSGGKLEYRKGQDLVAAAFRRFHVNHPEALLIFAWANQWPRSAATIAASPHMEGAPGGGADGGLEISAWLEANGLAAGSFVDLGMPANNLMPRILADADIAVFPSRCEPGTNLVAMECMAAGVPVILSANTGHLDLIAGSDGAAPCYVLSRQDAVAPPDGIAAAEGWGESSVDEILAHLESAFARRPAAAAIGEAGHRLMGDFTWTKQITRLVALLDERFGP